MSFLRLFLSFNYIKIYSENKVEITTSKQDSIVSVAEVDELPKPAGVTVHDSSSISKRFQQRINLKSIRRSLFDAMY